MKAQNLSISMPNYGCEKNCPYCISKMTGYLKANETLFIRNIKTAKNLAIASQVTSVSITGKGEPMLSIGFVGFVLDEFRDFPTELQTNGMAILKSQDILKVLAEYNLNVLAISIDNIADIAKYKDVIRKAKKLGMLTRFTVNLSDRFEGKSFQDIFNECYVVGIDQMSIRELSIPTDANMEEESVRAQKWIKDHVKDEYVAKVKFDMEKALKEKGRFLMQLPYGAQLYDYKGISITWFDYCVQDSNHGDDIRSLIYQEDGHLYLCWNSEASRIF
jgi:organic radical activating enzyme